MNVELLDKAVASALCPTFQALAAGSSVVSVVSLFGGPASAPVTVTAASVANLSMLGAAATCGEVEIGPDPYGGLTTNCTKAKEATILRAERTDGSETGISIALDATQINKIEPGTDQFGYAVWKVTYTRANGSTAEGNSLRADTVGGSPPPQSIGLIVEAPNECLQGPDPLPPPTNPTVPDVTYVDETTNCVYNVQFEGLLQEIEGGPIQPVYQISSQSVRRTDGGRIGGCFLDPTIYVGGPNGPGGPNGLPLPPLPVPPGAPGPGPDGVPWWAAPLLAGSTSAALNLIGQGIQRMFPPTLPEGSFTLQAPCDVDEQGNPLVQVWEYPEQSWAERSMAHEITMLEALQTHLNWKTPTCDCDPTIPEGDWRTISFRSEETSPYGKSRLRKRLRYRSVSGNDLGAVVDHWKDFSFEGGPCRVRWIGRTWGTIEVWASTESEGQRVIQHAAAEAGFSPLEDGRWSARVTRSSRLGVPSTMKVDTTGGYYWITARDGSDNRPIVALT